MGLLRANQDKLDPVIALLLESETIDGVELATVVGIGGHEAAEHPIPAGLAVAMKSTLMNKRGLSSEQSQRCRVTKDYARRTGRRPQSQLARIERH